MATNLMKVHALESEKSVIASFLSGDPSLEMFDLLEADDFFDPHCRSWWSVIVKLFEHNTTIAADTVAAYLHKNGNLNGDETMLIDLSGRYVPDPIMHGKIVKDFSLRRKFSKLSAKITTEVDKLTDSFEIGDMVQSELMEIAGATKQSGRGMSESVGDVLEEARRNAAGEITHPQTGIRSIDVIINGLRPGQLIILAARPSMGKTALALTMAYNNARAGVSTDFYSLEQPQNDIATRLISMDSGISANRILSLNEYDLPEIYKSARNISSLESKLRIDENSFESMSSLRSRIKSNIVKHGMRVAFIDYLGLINFPIPAFASTKDLQIGYITQNIKQIARDYKITIVLLCQLNRNVESRTSSRPVLSDLRDSGNIEQDADIVMFIDRDKTADNGTADIYIAKNRNGRIYDVKVAFRSESMHFMDAI